MAAMAPMAAMHIYIIVIPFSVALVVPVVTVAVVPEPASVLVAAMAVLVVVAVHVMVLLEMKKRNMALMVEEVRPVALPVPWVTSTMCPAPSRCQLKVALEPQMVVVAVEVEQLPNTQAQMSIWHLVAAAAVPAAAVVKPAT